jgi:hypothetical protein
MLWRLEVVEGLCKYHMYTQDVGLLMISIPSLLHLIA